MPTHSLFIGACILLLTIFFGVIAWTGRISAGSRVLLDRRTQPLLFWVVFFAFLGLISFKMTNLPDMLDRVAAMNAKKMETVRQP